MAHKTMVSGTERAITTGKVLVSGTERAITTGKALVSGTEYTLPFGNTTIGDLSVGDSVFFDVDGASREFIIVHKGLPSGHYDTSCDGVWVMSKYALGQCTYDSNGVNSYAASTLHQYLGTTWINTLEERVKNAVLQVKIPYWAGNGTDGALAYGSAGLVTKAFALSMRELGVGNGSVWSNDGYTLEYFTNAQHADRICYLATATATAQNYWTRSPYRTNTTSAYFIADNGSYGSRTVSSYTRTRPAFILPYDFEI